MMSLITIMITTWEYVERPLLLLYLLNKELLGSHLDQQQLTIPGVHLLGRVVEEDPEDDHRCA